jgi:hypothetical protein
MTDDYPDQPIALPRLKRVLETQTGPATPIRTRRGVTGILADVPGACQVAPIHISEILHSRATLVSLR